MTTIASPFPQPDVAQHHYPARAGPNPNKAADTVTASFTEIIQQRQATGVTLPAAAGARKQASVSSTKAQGAGRFIDGSLFGYASALPGASARPEAGSNFMTSSAPDMANQAVTSPTGLAKPAVAAELAAMQAVLAHGGQTSGSMGLDRQAAAAVALQESAVPDQADPTEFATAFALMLDNFGASGASPDKPADEGLLPITAAPVGAGYAVGRMADTADTFDDEKTASIASNTLDVRETQVDNLSPVHVAVLADGASLQIMARISGATASDEDQTGRSLLALAEQNGSAVGRLWLNGVERITAVGEQT